MIDPPEALRASLPHVRHRTPPYRPWLLAALLLFAVDRYVGSRFVEREVAPRYDPPNIMLMDRTAGNNVGVLFRLAERRRALTRAPLMVMVGDSTVMSAMAPPQTTLGWGLRRVVNDQLQVEPPLDVLEFSAPGMPATEAVLYIAKALGMGADLVTYSLTPRVLCMPNRPSSDVNRWIMDPDVRRMVGWRYLMDAFSAEDLVRSSVIARSDLLRFRQEVAADLEDELRVVFTSGAPQGPAYQAHRINPITKLGPLWTRDRCRFDPNSAQVRAVKRIIEMCAETGRCLLYHSPINPAGRTLFEDGLLGEFGLDMAAWTRQESVNFRNYSMLVAASGFNLPPHESVFRADAVHLNAKGRNKLAGLLGHDAATVLRTIRADLTGQNQYARAPHPAVVN